MHISGLLAAEKADIEQAKADIEIQKFLDERLIDCAAKTKVHAFRLYQSFGRRIFGRSMVTELLGIKDAAASKLIAKLLQAEVIQTVSGFGKGKYRFILIYRE